MAKKQALIKTKAMSIIKELRKKAGFTQMDLADKTGLSLRTIQRLETGTTTPKGHSLQVLSKVFDVETTLLQETALVETQAKETDKLSITLINLSTLAFFIIPFGNIILPFILWSKKRKSKLVDEIGRQIINFQLLWTITLCLLLCISPFINLALSFSFPLILIVLFIALGINLVVICTTALMIQRGKNDFLNLPIRLF